MSIIICFSYWFYLMIELTGDFLTNNQMFRPDSAKSYRNNRENLCSSAPPPPIRSVTCHGPHASRLYTGFWGGGGGVSVQILSLYTMAIPAPNACFRHSLPASSKQPRKTCTSNSHDPTGCPYQDYFSALTVLCGSL